MRLKVKIFPVVGIGTGADKDINAFLDTLPDPQNVEFHGAKDWVLVAYYTQITEEYHEGRH
jgi:hypothetical protein